MEYIENSRYYDRKIKMNFNVKLNIFLITQNLKYF